MQSLIDLRSDTVTRPTPEMRRAMAEAEVGDDVFGEDPTVRRLEEMAAARLGKQAGLLVVSGTMANQVSVMTHTSRGDEVIVERNAHVYYYEAGAMAVLSGVQPLPVASPDGILTPELIAGALRPPNIHFPKTTLLCLENTHNRAGGNVMTVEQMRAATSFAKEHGLAVHLDGARIFNAAVALEVEPRALAEGADSVMFCLSKGLGGPIGSVICGTSAFIERARRNRKIVGGGMRQAGIIAAAGIVCLERMVDRLAEDHENARVLAQGLAEMPGLAVEVTRVKTNIIMVEVGRLGPAARVAEVFRSHGVLASIYGPTQLRFVTHKDVSRRDIERALSLLGDACRELASA